MRKIFKINILRSLLCQCVHHCKFLNFACLVGTILHMGFYARSQLYPSAGHRTHGRSRVVRSWGANGNSDTPQTWSPRLPGCSEVHLQVQDQLQRGVVGRAAFSALCVLSSTSLSYQYFLAGLHFGYIYFKWGPISTEPSLNFAYYRVGHPFLHTLPKLTWWLLSVLYLLQMFLGRFIDHVLLIPWLCAGLLGGKSEVRCATILTVTRSQKMTEISNLAVPVLYEVFR